MVALAILLATLCFITPSMTVAATGTTTYIIGGILAYNSGRSTDTNNQRYLINMQQAINDLHSGYIQLNPPLPPNVNISIVWETSRSTASGAFLAAQSVLAQGASCILGPFLSEEATPVATLGSALQIPVLSPTVGLSDLSDKSRYPYFIRGRPVDIAIGAPLVALFRRMQWKRVCYLGTNEVYGRSLASWLDTFSLSGEISIQTSLFEAVTNSSAVIESAYKQLMTLLSVDCRIFVLHSLSSYASGAMIALERAGLLDNPKYTIVGTVEWPPSAATFSSKPPLRGTLGVIQSIPTNALWNTWYTRIKQLWPDEARFKWIQSPIAILESGWYDGVWLYAQAISNLLYVGLNVTGPNILAAVKSLNNRFEGISGPWSWDANYDRFGYFDIAQFQNNSAPTQLTRILSFNGNTSLPDYDTFTDYIPLQPWIYAGDAAHIARDGISTLIGDELIPKQNNSIIVLAFVIGLVACWSTLILMEQVMYAAEKQQRWWVWATACALTQGGPGVWALHMIATCSMSWPVPVDLFFNTSWAAGSLIITVIINLLAFYAGLYGWQSNKAWVDRGSSHHTSAAPATGQAAAKHIAGATVSPMGKSRKYDAEATQGSISSEATSAVTSGTRRRRRILQMAADHSVWGQLKGIPYRINMWFILGALLLSATTMISHFMIGQSVPSQYGTKVNPIPVVLFFVFGTPAFMFAILMSFYFFPTAGVRVIAAVLMHVINFISHIVANSGYTYSYSADTDGNTDYWWDPTLVILAVSIATAVLCFILLAINVDRMKLSRNALDLVVVRFKKELASTIAQVASANEKELYQRREKEKLWRMLETINLCRPMHRDHALATAFADYEAEAATLPALAAVTISKGTSTPSHASTTVSVDGLETKFGDDNTMNELKPPKVRAASALSVYSQLCSSIQLNGPTPDAVARDVKLEQLLRHPVTLELFKDSMIKDHNAENLMLYLDIRRYKVTSDPQLRAVLSREIFDSFIARGARYEVNVSDIMRKQLEAKFAYRIGSLSPASEDYSATPADMFQPIEDELMKLIQVNNMPRFVGTPTFNLCAMILGRPQFRLKQSSSMAQTPASRGRTGGAQDSPKNAIPIAPAFEGSDNESSHGRHRGARGGVAGMATRGSAVTNASAFATPIGVDATAMHINHAKNIDEPSIDGREYSAGANGATPVLGMRNGSPHNERRPLLASTGSVPDLSSPTAQPSYRSPMGSPVVAMTTLVDRTAISSSPLPPPSSRVPVSSSAANTTSSTTATSGTNVIAPPPSSSAATDVSVHIRNNQDVLTHQGSHGSARGLGMNHVSPNAGSRPSLPGTPTNGIASKRVALPGAVDGGNGSLDA